MIRIERIDPSHPLYPAACALREEVLLRDAGFTFAEYAAAYPYESVAEHFVAVLRHASPAPPSARLPEVVGTALLTVQPSTATGAASRVGKVSQVAVDPQLRGQGIGRALMAAVEARSFGHLGLHEIYCHAQTRAVGFYRRLGWGVQGEEFIEAGIPHFRMAMASDAAQDAGTTGRQALDPGAAYPPPWTKGAPREDEGPAGDGAAKR